MRILRFNETQNNKPKIIKKALFVSGDGSGIYVLCGSLEPHEFQNAKSIESNSFKRFGFVNAESIKEVDEYEDSDSIIWKNTWGHLMVNKSSYLYEGVYTNKFDTYYDLLEKYSDYKFEMLPYFIENTYGTSVPLVIEFFEKFIENDPSTKFGQFFDNIWKGVDITEVINYIKECGVYQAYDKLKQILLKDYRFAKYFEDVPKEDKDNADNLDKMGFQD